MSVKSSIVIFFTVFLFKPLLCATSDQLEANKTQLAISDGTFVLKEYNATFLNNKDKTVKYSTTGKIWHFQNEKDTALIQNLTLINQYYIFLIENLETLKVFLKQVMPIIINCGVILPNTTEFNTNSSNDFIQTLNQSIFMHNATTLEEFIPYSLNIETSNYFFSLEHQENLFIIPYTYLKTLSIIIFIVSIAIILLWNLKIKYTPGVELYFLQKVIIFLPYLNAIVCGLMIVQMFLVKDTKTSSFSDSRIYIETALITIRAIFRTMFWFLLVLVSSGWQITSQKLSRDKIKLFIKVFVFIYVTVCVDQIIDSFTGHIFVIFFPSEIKNIAFYLLIAISIFYEGRESLKLIQNKINYAANLSREFLPMLILKKKMMTFHIVFGVGYFFVFSLLLTIHKAALREYNIQDFLLINYHTIDLILLTLYLINYRPMKTPPYFNVEFGDDEVRTFGKIYAAKIPNILDIVDKGKMTVLKKEEIAQVMEDAKNNEVKVPLVVINPVAVNREGENRLTVNIIVDKLAVGFVSK